jgi:hypothetical protein
VNHTTPSAKTPSPKTGLFASLRAASLGVRGTGAPSPRRAPLALAALCAGLLALALFAASASAASKYSLTKTVEPLTAPGGVAVDNSTGGPSSGDVYVTEYPEHRVKKFSADGTELGVIEHSFGTAIWDAVSPIDGRLYVADFSAVHQFDNEGVFEKTITEANGSPITPASVAVNPADGRLYVADRGAGMIDIYSSAGVWEKQFSAGTSELDSIAVNAAGDVYVVNEFHDVTEFDENGTSLGVIDSNAPYAVAINPANGNVYVTETSPTQQVQVFDESNTLLAEEAFGTGEIGNSTGIGLSAALNVAYVASISNGALYLYQGEATGNQQPLKVEPTGTGAGTVTSAPSGINCAGPPPSGTCEHKFGENSTVTLTAEADGHSEFLAWTGCDNVTAEEKCEVEMTEAKTVQAEFEELPQQPLTVEPIGTGSGTVTSAPSAINCSYASPGPATGSCEAEFNENGTVTLTATHNERTTFAAWSGCASTTGPENEICHVTMSAPLTVEAEFEEIPQQLLEVETAGPGAGTVTGTSPGPEFEEINCGAKCSETYNQGATITLTAIPFGEKTVFSASGWEGCDNVNVEGKCEVEISSARLVTAIFEEIPQRTLTVERIGTGSGTVNGTSPGSEFTAIECGATCSAAYNEGAEITLTATRTSPSLFGGWSGCASLSGPENEECHLTLGASDLSVAATFFAPVPPLATTGEATAVGRAAATLHGSYDAEGSPATYRFLYVDAAHYTPGAEECLQANICAYALGSSTDLQNGATDSTEHAVTEALTGLKSGTTYHYALLVENPGGSARGEDMTFTTSAQPPSAATGAATEIGTGAATLHGSLDANGLKTTYRFQLGTSAEYTTTVFGSAGEEKGSFEVTLPMSGLQPATTYHYRLTATNADGTATGADATFTTGVFAQGTLPPPPDLKPIPVRPPSVGCRHGFLKRHGRCVRKPHHKRRHHR